MKELRKILVFLKGYKSQVTIYIVFNVLSIVLSLFTLGSLIPFLAVIFGTTAVKKDVEPLNFDFNNILDHIYIYLDNIKQTEGPMGALIYLSVFMLIITFLRAVFRYIASYTLSPVRNGVMRDIRNAVFSNILNLHLGYFSEERKGDIISRLTSDVQEIEVSIIRSLQVLIRNPLVIIVYVSALFFMNYKLTLFILILLPVSSFIISRVGKTLKRTSKKGQEKLGELVSEMEEALFGIRVIKAFNAAGRIINEFIVTNNRYTQLMTRMWRKKDVAAPLSELITTIILIAVMLFGGYTILQSEGLMKPESFIVYLFLFLQLTTPAKALTSAYYEVQKGIASVNRVDELLQEKSVIVEKPDAKKIHDFTAEIEFRNVSFKYRTEYVLRNINLTVKKGQTVALVGQSGSGKSTLADLIPRYYDVVEGEILIDGINVKDLTLESLRNLIGNVNQEPILFNDTIYNNILFGNPNASKQDVQDAALVANATEFIEHADEQYDTSIGDRGARLSGGQRQRLSIARAIIKNPPIMILDEATSALDTESERLVQSAITNLMKNRTSIVIAHRLSTIVHADVICVLQNGEIVEKGTHEELLSADGYYSKLHGMQS